MRCTSCFVSCIYIIVVYSLLIVANLHDWMLWFAWKLDHFQFLGWLILPLRSSPSKHLDILCWLVHKVDVQSGFCGWNDVVVRLVAGADSSLLYTVKTVPPFPLRGRLYSFSWGKYYLFQMEKPSFPTSSILIWESSPFLRWRGPFSQLGEHRLLFNGMLDIFSRMNTVLLTIDLNRKEFHYQKSYQLL